MRSSMSCDRCRLDTHMTTVSQFNTDIICMACKWKEQQRPDYPRAPVIKPIVTEGL